MNPVPPSPEILGKVRKLLALGASPSEAEAASALEKARVLLARYGLSVTDLDAQEPQVSEGVLLEKKRLRTWESHLIHVISRSTFTQPLHIKDSQGSRIVLVGRDINLQAARDLFDYLHRVVLITGRAHSGSVAHLESFKTGMVTRIGERLEDTGKGSEEAGGPWAGSSPPGARHREPETGDRALVIKMSAEAEKENARFVQEKYGSTKTKRVGRRVDAESYHRGRAAGEGVSLNRQLR